ncbi:MAG: response regulator [Pseudomonadota bacterium]
MTEKPSTNYVLIVDDDEEDVFALKWALDRSLAQMDAVHIDDGADALDFLLSMTEVRELPDLVILDINMPGVDGYETLAAIRASDITAHIPVLMFSTSDSAQEIKKSYLSGANAHLVKPNSIRGLQLVAESVSQFWLNTAALPNKQ